MNSPKNGKLIVIEGLDGSGKATQTKLLYERLLSLSINVKRISFPDYEQESSSLVKLYLNSELGDSPDDVNAYAASSFFAVDRIASYIKSWKKFYQIPNSVVIADRYTTSNAIYHMNKLPLSQWDEYLQWLEDFEYQKLGLPRPDAVIYLHMPVEISQMLIKKRYHGNNDKKDLHEKNVNFLKLCASSAEYALKKLGWQKVLCCEGECVRDQKSIHDEVFSLSMEALNVKL